MGWTPIEQDFSSFFAIFDDFSMYASIPGNFEKSSKFWQKMKKSLVQKLIDESSIKSIMDCSSINALAGEFRIRK